MGDRLGSYSRVRTSEDKVCRKYMCWSGEDSLCLRNAELKVDLSGTILTSGTGLQLVCQSTPANSSMLYPNVEDYEGPIGLSSPTAYL